MESKIMQNLVFYNFLSHSGNECEQKSHFLMDDLVRRHGFVEWKAVTLTHELHGHVGVYSVIGAKMGVYALELFGASKGRLAADSMAGYLPPFSCMNDGIQASTGATVGNGRLRIVNADNPTAGACFTDSNFEVRIILRDEYRQKLLAFFKKAPGLPVKENTAYWEYVEQLSLNIWREWERDRIFLVEEGEGLPVDNS